MHPPLPLVFGAALLSAALCAQERRSPISAVLHRGGTGGTGDEADALPAQFEAAAQPALDATWQLCLGMLGAPETEAPAMVVHVYNERDDYIRASEKLGGPDPRVFPGFASYRHREAHVFVGERPFDGSGKLGPWAVDGIVHETMHLASAAVHGRGFGFHPRWYVEGIAMWAESRIGGEPGERDAGGEGGDRDAAAPRDIFSAARARTLLEDGRVTPVARILLGDTGDLSQVDEYPVHRVLFELLMTAHGDAMQRWLPQSVRMPESPKLPQQLVDSLRSELGEAAWNGLDAALRARIAALAENVPRAEFRPPPDLRGKPGEADYHPGSPTIRWGGEVAKDRLVLTATVTVRDAGCGQTDVVFGRFGTKRLRVCLAPGAGVLVLGRDQEGEEAGGWQVLGRSKGLPEFVLGKPVHLRIVAMTGSVTVSLDGRRVLRAVTKGWPVRGDWGMGAPDGCRASWRDVRVQH